MASQDINNIEEEMTPKDFGFKLLEYLATIDIKNMACYYSLDERHFTFDYDDHFGNPVLVVEYGILRMYLIYFLEEINPFGVTDDLQYLQKPPKYKYLPLATEKLLEELARVVNIQKGLGRDP